MLHTAVADDADSSLFSYCITDHLVL